ncbi:hypothetical protein [Methylomonas sp.]|jgi:hypothetical protein|uniref:hypothetical protein n=1 Tax=Methylomonas sp. TaxID=418 RepID=UPI0025DBB420|nr:hypothetical protein [Methylomonas sp.]
MKCAFFVYNHFESARLQNNKMGDASLMDMDDALILEIYSWGYPEEMYRLREVCKRFANVIPPPTKYNPNNLLYIAAGMHQIRRCIIAKENGATDFDAMLHIATIRENADLCILAKSFGATGFDFMIVISAQRGNQELCALAEELGATNFDGMLDAASEIGNRELCILAKNWGVTSTGIYLMRWNAMQSGNTELLELAETWLREMRELAEQRINEEIEATANSREIERNP